MREISTVCYSNANKLGYYLFGARQPTQGFLKSAGSFEENMKLLLLLLITCALMSVTAGSTLAQNPTTPADLRKVANDYYNWRNQNYPVFSSDNGLHTWDNRLTDYSLSSILARRLHIKELLGKVEPMQTSNWAKDDRIDWLLFRSELEGSAFFNRVMDFEATDA